MVKHIALAALIFVAECEQPVDLTPSTPTEAPTPSPTPNHVDAPDVLAPYVECGTDQVFPNYWYFQTFVDDIQGDVTSTHVDIFLGSAQILFYTYPLIYDESSRAWSRYVDQYDIGLYCAPMDTSPVFVFTALDREGHVDSQAITYVRYL